MLALLSPRLWIAIALVALLAFSHWKAYSSGAENVTTAWNLSVAEANATARETERLRQRAVDAASVAAAAREAGIRADATRAAGAAAGLRRSLAALPSCGEPGTAPAVHATAVADVLGECGDEVGRLAAAADGHANDVRTLIDAWPR